MIITVKFPCFDNFVYEFSGSFNASKSLSFLQSDKEKRIFFIVVIDVCELWVPYQTWSLSVLSYTAYVLSHNRCMLLPLCYTLQFCTINASCMKHSTICDLNYIFSTWWCVRQMMMTQLHWRRVSSGSHWQNSQSVKKFLPHTLRNWYQYWSREWNTPRLISYYLR